MEPTITDNPTTHSEADLALAEAVEDDLKTCQAKYPEAEFWAGDLRDPACPVDIDWWGWTRSRVLGDKYGSRNARFAIKDEQP